MKNIKYVLFAIIICFISYINVNALTCTYQSSDINLTCNVNNKSISCSIDKSYVTYVSGYMNLKVTDFLNNGYLDCNILNNVYVDLQSNKDNQYRLLEIKKDNICVKSIVDRKNNPDFYTDAIVNTACKSFTLTKATKIEKFDLSELVLPNDIENNSSNNDNTNSSNNSNNNLKNIETSIIGGINKNNNNTSNTNTTDLDLENFCSTKVQGVFTTIGWVLFIIKIVVPIIIMVMGSIDFFKTAVSTKDVEVNKAVHILIKRAIAGIVIFFIPTIIRFVVNLTGQNDTYNGSFKQCTNCMLKPNDSSCRGLGGN